MNAFFVTGTDTDVGKSFVSALLSYKLSKTIPVTYFKPIQAGAPTDTDYVSRICGEKVKLKESSFCLQAPMSPNRAADQEGIEINTSKVIDDWGNRDTNFHIVEGAGGLHVPINNSEMIIDLIEELKIPCLLVASTKLGTINHTLLSLEALKRRGIECLGIVLNGEEDPGLEETLSKFTDAPILFRVPPMSEGAPSVFDSFDDQGLRGFIDYCQMSFATKSNGAQSENLTKKDSEFVWHPFTQHGIVKKHPLVRKAKGSYLWFDNKKVIDAVSSWWVNLLGHCNPEISNSVGAQAHVLEHVIFAGFTHEPAVQLSERLTDLATRAGANLHKAFFSDNGSTSVEVALKMSYQFFQQKGDTQRKKFIALQGSYHGDTIGSMSLGERKGFNEVFSSLLFDVEFVDPFSPESVDKVFNKNPEEIAAVIVEPMVQGAAGMRMYPVEILNKIAKKAKEAGAFVICDEVFTGFYRTGKMFAFEHSEMKPDFLCLSKGLTGGYLPLAVTLATKDIFEFFKGDDMKKAFLHGHSYTANPIACRAALKTLEILERPETLKNISRVVKTTAEVLRDLKGNEKIYNIRQLGTIGAMELHDEDPNYFKGDFSYRFNQRAIEHGVLLRPLGGTVYSVPPYCISDDEIEKIYGTIDKLVKEEL